MVELKSGGKDIPVTSANRIAYIHLVADYRLNRQIRQHCLAFRQGLANVVNLEWLRMFDQQEIQVCGPPRPGTPLRRDGSLALPAVPRCSSFQVLISGAQVPISLEDLKSFTNYSGALPLRAASSRTRHRCPFLRRRRISNPVGPTTVVSLKPKGCGFDPWSR